MTRALAIALIIGGLGFPGAALGTLEPNDSNDGTWDYYDSLESKPAHGNKPPSAGSSRKVAPPYRVRFSAPSMARPEDPDAIAVVIANGAYRNGIPNIDYARNDGETARAFMRNVFGVRPGNIIELTDAGQADMFSVFGNDRSHQGKLWSWIKPGRSKVYVYYSGHGVPGIRDGRAYLLPVDADPATAEINGYPLELLYKNLAKLETRSATVFLEACFSGNSERGPLIRSASPVFVKSTQPSAAPGITVLSAARNDQIASWDHEARLGLFTHYLTRALYGEADGGRWGDGDGNVTLGEIEAFLDDEMTYAARRQHQRVQQTTLSGDRYQVVATVEPGGVAPKPVFDSRPVSAAPRAKLDISSLRGGGLAGARSFIAAQRAGVIQTIREYYDIYGLAWDQTPDDYGGGTWVERLNAVDAMTVIGVSGDRIDLLVSYSATDGNRTVYAKARMTLLAADGMKIIQMWR